MLLLHDALLNSFLIYCWRYFYRPVIFYFDEVLLSMSISPLMLWSVPSDFNKENNGFAISQLSEK